MRKKRSINNIMLCNFICIFFIISLTIGFSAISTKLDISNLSATIRPEKDIRVTNIQYSSGLNDGIAENYDYNINNINGTIKLPNNNSSVTFEVYVTNIGNTKAGIKEITNLDSRLTYEITNYTEGSILCDTNNNSKCTLGSTTLLLITIKYKENITPTSDSINFVATFDFREVYEINYINISNTNSFPKYILENETLSITFKTDVPYDVKIMTSDSSILPNNNYTYTVDTTNNNYKVLTINYINENLTIDRYYSINYILNGGNNNTDNPTKYANNDNTTIKDPNYTGNIFGGWYDNSSYTGTTITNTNQLSGNVTLYAKWTSDAVSYNINYILNGGTQANNQITSYYSSIPQTILNPENTHDALFDGWYENSGFTGTIITSTSQLSGNTTLYAKWVGNIPNTTFNTSDNRFTTTNVNSLSTQNLVRGTTYQYTQSSANTTINSITIYMTYGSGNKSATITCQLESNSPGFTTSQNTINLTTGATSASTTITLNNPIQKGYNYTISFPSRTGDNNGKIRISNISFLINP